MTKMDGGVAVVHTVIRHYYYVLVTNLYLFFCLSLCNLKSSSLLPPLPGNLENTIRLTTLTAVIFIS